MIAHFVAFDEYINFQKKKSVKIDLLGPEGPHNLRKGQLIISQSLLRPFAGFDSYFEEK